MAQTGIAHSLLTEDDQLHWLALRMAPGLGTMCSSWRRCCLAVTATPTRLEYTDRVKLRKRA
jgi:hypothetical protein